MACSIGDSSSTKLYKWWPWVDLDLFYGKAKLGHLYVWMGKTVIKFFNGGKLAAKDYIDWIILLMKKNWPQGVVCPCPGAKYLYMTTIFKHLLHWNRLANQSQILCGASLGRGNESYVNGPGHMTKMAAMPIYGKNFWKSSSPELEVLWSWNLACSIRDSSSTKFI